MSSALALLRRRPHFRNLWLGEAISLGGDWLSYVAISLIALDQGGGALALALVFAAHMAPTALIAPLAGVVADRIDRRKLMIAAQLGQAVLMVAMAGAALAGSLIAVQLLVLIRTLVAGLFFPAKQAALKRVVEPDELVEANALDAATWAMMFAVGTALGGLLALLGPVVALLADGLTFIVAAVILAKLPAMPVVRRDDAASSLGPSPHGLSPRGLAGAVTTATRDMRGALRHAADRPALFEAVLTKAPLGLAGGAGWLLLNVTAYEATIFGSAALALGLLQSLRGVGTGVGPALAKRLMASGWSARGLMRKSAAFTFASIALFIAATFAGLWLLVPAALLWGMGSGGGWVFSYTEIQRRGPDEMLGRLASVDMLAFTLCMSASALGAALLIDTLALSASAGAAILLVAGAALYVALRAWTTSLETLTATPSVG